MVLYEPEQDDDESEDVRDEQIRYYCQSGKRPPSSHDIELYTDVATREAKFYAWGSRLGLRGKVYIASALQIDDFLRGAMAATSTVAAILVVFALQFGTVVGDASAGAAVLLIVPAVFAYFLSRPSEHFLAGGFLRGLRRAIMTASVWPLLGAAIIASCGNSPAEWAEAAFPIVAVLSVFNALCLLVVYVGRARLTSSDDERS